MYGKLFDSCYTGSMFGAGSVVFAIWGYVIANTVNSQVELNPRLLAHTIGESEENITIAIEFLEKEDPNSRTPTEGGRRLVREGRFAYRVVNHERYRELRSEDARRDYMRNYMRERRASEGVAIVNVNEVNKSSQLAQLAHTEARYRSKIQKQKKSSRNGNGSFADDSREMKAATYLLSLIRKNNQKFRQPNMNAWAKEFDAIFRIDERSSPDVRKIIDWSQSSDFWMRNVLSPKALRKNFDRLTLEVDKPLVKGQPSQPKPKPFVIHPEKPA